MDTLKAEDVRFYAQITALRQQAFSLMDRAAQRCSLEPSGAAAEERAVVDVGNTLAEIDSTSEGIRRKLVVANLRKDLMDRLFDAIVSSDTQKASSISVYLGCMSDRGCAK